MASRQTVIEIDVRGVPELISDVRAEMAKILRDEADADADPRISRRLISIADAFECGQVRSTDG